MNNDFTFEEIRFEIRALGEHLKLLKKNMPEIRESEEDKERFEIIVIRNIHGSFLISLWAVYESAVGEIADYIKNKKGFLLKINDLKGPVLEKIKKYYDTVLNYKLHEEEKNGDIWRRLECLNILRNVFAHGNGRLDIESINHKNKIRDFIDNNDNIEIIRNEIIIPDYEYLSKSYSLINELIVSLIFRVERDFTT